MIRHDFSRGLALLSLAFCLSACDSAADQLHHAKQELIDKRPVATGRSPRGIEIFSAGESQADLVPIEVDGLTLLVPEFSKSHWPMTDQVQLMYDHYAAIVTVMDVAEKLPDSLAVFGNSPLEQYRTVMGIDRASVLNAKDRDELLVLMGALSYKEGMMNVWTEFRWTEFDSGNWQGFIAGSLKGEKAAVEFKCLQNKWGVPKVVWVMLGPAPDKRDLLTDEDFNDFIAHMRIEPESVPD